MYEKWDPSSPACAFQHYFYNQVPEESAPYYAPGPGEDEKKWEEALKERPSPGSIPVLARGPLAVGRRLETQATWVRGIQTRLHELNDILSKRMQVHDLEYSVRAQEARRKHVALSRRCLSLATKVQVLRNRGYALDSTEEQLRVKLVQLEKVAFDPMLSGRQEEVWARMSVVRQRAQMLQSETEKLGKQVNTSTEELLDDEQMKRIERVSHSVSSSRPRLSTITDSKQLRGSARSAQKGTRISREGSFGLAGGHRGFNGSTHIERKCCNTSGLGLLCIAFGVRDEAIILKMNVWSFERWTVRLRGGLIHDDTASVPKSGCCAQKSVLECNRPICTLTKSNSDSAFPDISQESPNSLQFMLSFKLVPRGRATAIR